MSSISTRLGLPVNRLFSKPNSCARYAQLPTSTSINIVIPLVQSYIFFATDPTDVNLEGKQSLTKFQKEHHPLSLFLYTGRSADALVKLIFPRLSLSLSQLFTFANGSDQDQTQTNWGKNIWAYDMKHAKLKIALILSNVRLCRTKADISKSVQNGFSSETFVTRSMDWPKHRIVLFHIQRNQANAGTKDHPVQALLSLSLSLSLSLFSFTTCFQNLQIIWIQKIVGCFSEPDQGLTVIPRVNLVRACAILRPMRTIRWAT